MMPGPPLNGWLWGSNERMYMAAHQTRQRTLGSYFQSLNTMVQSEFKNYDLNFVFIPLGRSEDISSDIS